MFRGRLTLATIQTLATSDRSRSIDSEQVVGSWLNPTQGNPLPTAAEDIAGPVSFESWIQPAANESGRILDKLTVGKGDGFLLDCWPNLSLRLIVGDRQRDFPDILKPGVWQHVAIVIDRGILRVYLNGQLIDGER